jgi:hypothetical protein
MLACDAILERHGDLDPLELMQNQMHAAPKHRAKPPKAKAPSPASAVQRRRMSKLERGASASDDECFGRDDDDDSAVSVGQKRGRHRAARDSVLGCRRGVCRRRSA